MNVMEAFRPVTFVLQLFGLCMEPPCKHGKTILQCYSLLLITLKTIAFLSMIVNHDAIPPNDAYKIASAVKFAQFSCDFMLDIIILVEAFIKAYKEKEFMKNMQEIDCILVHHFDVDLKINELKRSAVKRLVVWICVIGLISVRFLRYHFNSKNISIVWFISRRSLQHRYRITK